MTLRLSAALLVAAISAFAAPPAAPVHWQANLSPVRPLRPGAAFNITLNAAIDEPWHLYALDEPDGGPTSTEISITDGDPADLLSVDQSRPITHNDPVFSQPTRFFQGSALFTLHLRLNRQLPAGSQSLHLLVRYQSCNDRLCLPPHTDTIEVPLPIAR